MAKVKTSYFCQNCGSESAKWVGKCQTCGEWNTYVEEIVSKPSPSSFPSNGKVQPINIKEVGVGMGEQRISSGIGELDRVLGGGIVAGSLVLVGGEPGIGKSTIMLQMAVKHARKTLYISGEESNEQIKMRADRLDMSSEACYLLATTTLVDVLQQADRLSPDLLIIDSIQTMYSDRVESAVGSISQVKECTGQLLKFAKQKNIPIFLIGHVNKDGAIAGPKVLEHMVDTVLQFEGDRYHSYRMLRTVKNRFGSSAELGMFEMQANGFREVTNPSEILISPHETGLSGVALGVSMEGNRPLVLEIQALVTNTIYGNPQRSATGYDYKRLMMLLAVVEKRLGLRMSNQDVFLNIAGGLKIQDTAIDMAICCALFSSLEDISISEENCFAAEVGLGGELRPLARIEQRIKEAEKLKFKNIYVSKYNIKKEHVKDYNICVKSFSKLSDVFKDLF